MRILDPPKPLLSTWCSRVSQHVREDERDPLGTDRDNATHRQVAALLTTARAAAAVIDGTLDDASVRDRSKYENVVSMLDEIVEFDDFSLAEYTYSLSDGHPGIRLLIEGGSEQPRLTLLLFEDTNFWRVDWEGRRVSYEMLSIALGGEQPVPHVPEESMEYFRDVTDATECLVDALCVPVRLMHRSSMS